MELDTTASCGRAIHPPLPFQIVHSTVHVHVCVCVFTGGSSEKVEGILSGRRIFAGRVYSLEYAQMILRPKLTRADNNDRRERSITP